jgi:cysteine-rich repeat protein
VDPSWHYFAAPADKATLLLENYISFAAAEPGETGAFVLLSCYYGGISAASPVPVPFLSGFGSFESHGYGGLDEGHITATHPALTGMTDDTISSWGTTVHEVFSAWPSNFEVLAISPDGTGFVAGDGVEGAPFVLARGVIPSSCGNGTLDPAEECDDGNNEDGDGCDAACNLEVCGDAVVQGGEACDDGNTEAGDGCSATCEVEACIPEAL